MPSTGRPPASRRPMTSSPRTARMPSTQARNAPTPGTTRPSALLGAGLVGGQLDPGAGALERAHGRADVAEAVVEDHDPGAPGPRPGQACGHRVPFVDGTPVSRGS